MEEIFTELSSPKWWISVVIAGIVINLVAAYAKPVVDKLFSSSSSWWKVRSDKKKTERINFIEELSKDPHLQIMASIDELRDRSRAKYTLLLGVFIVVSINMLSLDEAALIFFMGLAALCFFVSFLMFVSATSSLSRLSEAQKVNKKR